MSRVMTRTGGSFFRCSDLILPDQMLFDCSSTKWLLQKREPVGQHIYPPLLLEDVTVPSVRRSAIILVLELANLLWALRMLLSTSASPTITAVPSFSRSSFVAWLHCFANLDVRWLFLWFVLFNVDVSAWVFFVTGISRILSNSAFIVLTWRRRTNRLYFLSMLSMTAMDLWEPTN